MMGTPPAVALWLGLGALLPCLWAARTDLARLKIPNNSVLALAGVFLLGGLALVALTGWSLGDWAWRWTHLVVVLLIGMGLNAIYMIGAGDAKFAAAAAPFFALSDWRTLLWLYPLVFLVCWALHRLAKHTVGQRLAPGWASWTSGKRFPMGVAIAATLLAYLAICAIRG
jgi:prepilin peptidase CpaA